MKKVLLSLFVVIVFIGCSSYLMRKQFDESVEGYNQAVRWREWDNASQYLPDSIQAEFMARAAAAKDVRMVDYRIVGKTYNEEHRVAIVRVEIDYYNVSSQTMKTAHDTQKWAYEEAKGTKGWRLMSLPLEFR